MFQTLVVETIKTYFVFNNSFVVYEMTIWRTRFACWITKATNTLS